jgi:hypothetical protein
MPTSSKKVSKTLRPTELLIFGNPQGGTPLMECAQTTVQSMYQAATANLLGWARNAVHIRRIGNLSCSTI